MRIDELEFSARTYNCLKRAKIDTVEQLLEKSDDELMKIRCFGISCLREVQEKIRKPSVPGPSESAPNLMELCFHNGEQHMKDKIKTSLMKLSADMPCVTISQVIKILEDLQ
jgi:DNA-directed RNA polymerase alpha subunit